MRCFSSRSVWDVERTTTGLRPFLTGKPAAVVAAIAAYLGTRAYLTATHPYAHAASGIGLSILVQQTNVIPLAIWTGLAGS
jgi:hypothetical protein